MKRMFVLGAAVVAAAASFAVPSTASAQTEDLLTVTVKPTALPCSDAFSCVQYASDTVFGAPATAQAIVNATLIKAEQEFKDTVTDACVIVTGEKCSIPMP